MRQSQVTEPFPRLGVKDAGGNAVRTTCHQPQTTSSHHEAHEEQEGNYRGSKPFSRGGAKNAEQTEYRADGPALRGCDARLLLSDVDVIMLMLP